MTTITMRVVFRTARQPESSAPAVATPKPHSPIARRIALAHHVETLIERGELRDLAHAAERFGVSRARMTQEPTWRCSPPTSRPPCCSAAASRAIAIYELLEGTLSGQTSGGPSLPCFPTSSRRPSPMTATETVTSPTTTDTWTVEMAQLRSRYKAVREPILAALNILHQDPNVTDDDAKARAAMRGVKITAASLNGARTLLAKASDAPEAATPSTVPAAALPTTTAPQRPARRVRAAEAELDPTAMLQQVVAKLQQQGHAEADRLRDGIRKALAALQALVA